MKKLIPVLLTILLLASCGKNDYKIEDRNWEFSMALGENGVYAAYSAARVDPDDALFDGAEEIDMELTADNGALTLTAGEKIFTGTYVELDMTGSSRVYEVKLGNEQGTAAVSETEYFGDAAEMTLVLSIDGYALYFYEK